MKKIVWMAVLIAVFLFSTTMAEAGSVKLAWNPPNTNADGTVLTDLAGYKIYWGTSSGNYTSSKTVSTCIACPVPTGLEEEFDCLPLLPGTTYYFVATAFDTSGNESAYSNEVSKTTAPATIPLGNVATTPTATLCRVDGYDLIKYSKVVVFLAGRTLNDMCQYGTWASSGAEICDLNYDGLVNILDQLILSSRFGQIQCP